jgi:hypothetical protein
VEEDLWLQLRHEVGQRVAADVELVQRETVAQVLAASTREIVDDMHLVTAREQTLRNVRADESGSAGNDRAHRLRIVGLPPRRQIAVLSVDH